jgi:hypothetical protein
LLLHSLICLDFVPDPVTKFHFETSFLGEFFGTSIVEQSFVLKQLLCAACNIHASRHAYYHSFVSDFIVAARFLQSVRRLGLKLK